MPPATLAAVLIALALLPARAPQPAGAASTMAAPAGALVRYTNAEHGYTLSIPAGWTRLSGVRWTPAGVPADLTAMTPDRQALLGVMVAPTGGRAYADADLQQVGENVIDQQDAVQGGRIRHSRVVIQGVAFQASIATFRHGGETQADSWMAVLVAVRHRRLYAFTGLVYDRTIHFIKKSNSNDGENPTPTDTATDVPFGGYRMRPEGAAPRFAGAALAAPTAAAGGGSWARALLPRPLATSAAGPRGEVRLSARAVAAGTPAVPAIGHPGRNACPTLIDEQNPVVLDKNCAFGLERLLIAKSFASITIDPRLADDPRPAPAAGVDGFAQHADAADGYAIDYPAQWARIGAAEQAGGGFTVQASDKKAVVTVAVAPAGGKVYSSADLRTIADHALEQTGDLSFSKVTHRTFRVNGGAVVLADDPTVDVDVGGGATAQTHVTALVGAYHRRVYAVVAAVYHIGGGPADFGDVQARFFAPFDTVARQAGAGNFDAHDRAQQLALASLTSLHIDPRVRVDSRPAAAVGVDGFTAHTNAADGYTISYPAAWARVASSGTDLSVRSRDKKASLIAAVQPAGGTVYAPADLRAVADREIAQIGKVSPSSITYTTSLVAGSPAVVAIASSVDVPTSQFGVASGTVTVVVTARHRRLYGFLGFAYQFGTDRPGDSNVVASAMAQQLVLASLDMISFDPRIRDDPRPAPLMGIDGFTTHRDGAQGYAIGYPADWTEVSNPGGGHTVRSPDKRALLAVAVLPTNGKSYSDANLRDLADGQIKQVGQVGLGGISHGAVRIGGVTYQAASADVSPTSGGLATVGADSRMVVLAAAHAGRVYGFLALVNRSSGAGDNNPRYDVENQIIAASFNTIVLS